MMDWQCNHCDFFKTSETTDESILKKQFEFEVKPFLDQYDNSEMGSQNQTTPDIDNLNSNFTVQEVEVATDYLKMINGPGVIMYMYQ